METWNCYSGQAWNCDMFVATYVISKSAEQFGKNPTALVNTPLNLQEPKDYKAVVTLKFNKIPESSVKRKLALNILQKPAKEPNISSFLFFFYGLFKEMWHDLGLWWHKRQHCAWKKPQKLTTLKVTQKIHILNSKKF